jgi:hypothetical protein
LYLGPSVIFKRVCYMTCVRFPGCRVNSLQTAALHGHDEFVCASTFQGTSSHCRFCPDSGRGPNTY